MLVDSWGRDLNWLRARAPAKPPMWKFIFKVFWPLQAIELWEARVALERASRKWPHCKCIHQCDKC